MPGENLTHEPDPYVLRDAAERAIRYRDGIRRRGVAAAAEAISDLARLGGALPEHGESPERTVALLDEVGSPATTASTGGRYFGFVTGGVLPAAIGASWLATAWDQNAALAAMSPVAAEVERVAIRWTLEALGLPPTCGAALTTGATMANFTGLAAARHAILARAGWDVEARGLIGAPPLTVIVGEECHASLRKALGMLGLGRDSAVVVPADGQGRLRADRLPRLDAASIVCLQAGNVNTGASDPFPEVCDAAGASGAWVHVDGAFGLWAAAAPRRAAQVADVERADSWATDAHKWLNVPYDSGLAFVRDPVALRGAMSLGAAYLPASGTRDAMDFTPESSRRARGVEIWAALRSLGRSGLADLIERHCRQAARFADGLRGAGFGVPNEVVLNQVLVDFGDEALTRRVIAAVQADGTCWCGGTVWKGRAAMRISVSSWATTDGDVDASLAAIVRIARTEIARG